MAHLPLMKLGGLLVKSLTKPVAKQFKARAAHNPAFRGVCASIGRGTHYTTTTLQNILVGRFPAIPVMREADAVSTGAEVLGEGMIIGSAAAVIVFEYTRNERKKARDKVKQRIKAEAKAKLAARRFEDMEYRIARLEAALAANTVTLDARGRRTTGQGGGGSGGGGTRALLQPHATVVWAPLPPAHQHGSESLDETGDD